MTAEERIARHAWDPDDLKFSQCLTCRWKKPLLAACYAFPEGIPSEIESNEVDHRRPYGNDLEIQWEPRTRAAKHPLANR